MEKTKRFYTATDIAERCGCTVTAVDNWIARGILPPPMRPGGPRGRRVWYATSIDAILEILFSPSDSAA